MNRLLSAILQKIRRDPDGIFCHFLWRDTTRALSWSDLGAQISAVAVACKDLALPFGGVVPIFLRHRPELYSSFVGAMFAGLVPTFMPCPSHKQDPQIYWNSHRKLLAHIEPSAIVLDKKTLFEMRQSGLPIDRYPLILIEEIEPAAGFLPRFPDERAVAFQQHSSGTTGLKKGVALSYRAVTDQLDAYAAVLHLERRDRIVSWLPLYHDMGLVACFLLPLFKGIPFVHLDHFDWVARPRRLFDAIAAHRGTLTWLPNFAFEHLVASVGEDTRVDLGSMRAFINCSEPCRMETFERFLNRFRGWGVAPNAMQCCYAMAETVFCVSQTRLDSPPQCLAVEPRSTHPGGKLAVLAEGYGAAARLMNVGRPIDGIEISIRDDNDRPLPEGSVGEIALRGDFLFAGYFRDSSLTAERIRNGWYYSRDLGCVIGGDLYVLGRLDDLLIVNGRNFYAHEIEALVDDLGHTKPGRCVAFTSWDERARNNNLIVVAETKDGIGVDPDELVKHVTLSIVSTVNVQPRDVRLVAPGWLIKTTSGKISRSENSRKYLVEREVSEGWAHA